MLTRRDFLSTTAGGLVASLAASGTAFASAPTEKRLVVMVLRGGLDGLHTLVPYADSDYRRLRPVIGLESNPGDGPGVINLDGYFGLHKALAPLMPLYDAGDLMFLPAAATQYRERSHFDGQNMLENGSGRPYGARDGWLNRAILGLNDGDHRLGLSLGPSVPLILQGDADVQTWDDSGLPEVDEDFLIRLTQMYRSDPLFLDALHDATGAMKPDVNMAGLDDIPRQGRDFALSARVAGDLLSRPDGPRIAVMELGGWDTHFSQEGRIRRLLGHVAQGLLDLRTTLGSTWTKTSVLIVSEFGRTAAENASRGTDHGTGGIAMLAGGAVKGGRINGDWPGLSPNALWEGRDLRAVNSYEALFKTMLIGHLGLDQAFVEDRVFPGSSLIQPMDGLLI